MHQKTQQDIVNQMKMEEETTLGEQQFKRKVAVPGIQTLHQKSADEIAEVLTNVLRSQPDITEIRWVVGEFIELTSKDPLP